jgi:hypothetical protein
MSFGVNLDDDCFPRHVLGGARNLRRGCAARSAPRCPEVDQDRNLSVLNDFVEKSRICRERFRYRGKVGFASAAAARVGQMSGGDTVLLAALSTRSDDWQDGSSFGRLDA